MIENGILVEKKSLTKLPKGLGHLQHSTLAITGLDSYYDITVQHVSHYTTGESPWF